MIPSAIPFTHHHPIEVAARRRAAEAVAARHRQATEVRALRQTLRPTSRRPAAFDRLVRAASLRRPVVRPVACAAPC